MDLRREWYVDAWAVRDGLAFASLRASDDLRSATQSVFIAAPSLDATPLGSVSSGLWATRANFQDGLVSENGEEIGFDSLVAVKELVRRGYLAGGIGPGPDGGEEPKLPRPPGDGPSPVEQHFDRRLADLDGDPEWFPGSKGIGDKEKRRGLFRSLLSENAVDGLFHYLRIFGEATIAVWVEQIRSGHQDATSLADLVYWSDLLHAVGLWESPAGIYEAMEATGLDRLLGERIRWGYSSIGWRGWPSATVSSGVQEQIVLRVPCPLRSYWDRRIKRLSDKLLLAVCTYSYFDLNQKLPEFIPALLAALAVVVQARPAFAGGIREARPELLKAGLDWLSEQMPQLKLPDVAEDALTKFAWGELDGR